MGLIPWAQRWVVLEPLVCLATMAFGAYITQQGIYRQKIETANPGQEEDEVERQTSEFIRNCTIIETLLELIVMLAAGSISDRHGRKLPLIWALLLWSFSLASVALLAWIDSDNLLLDDKQTNFRLQLDNVSSLLFDKDKYEMVNSSSRDLPGMKRAISLLDIPTNESYFMYTDKDEMLDDPSNPGLPLLCYYLPSLLYGLSGGAFAVFVLTFSYLGDLAAREPSSRLKRFTATETSLSLGTVTGYYLASLVSTHLGTLAVLLLSAGCLLLAAVYACLRLENILPEGGDRKELNLISRLRGLRAGALGHRWLVPALATLFLLQETPRSFDSTLLYLYLGNDNFVNWTSSQILAYKAATTGCAFLGQLFVLPVLVGIFHLPLMLIGLATVASRLAHFVLLGIASSPGLLWVAAAVNCLEGVQKIIIRSSLSASCPPANLGSVFALCEVVISLLPLALSSLASAIYNASLCEGCLLGSWALAAACPLLLQLPIFLLLLKHYPSGQPEEKE